MAFGSKRKVKVYSDVYNLAGDIHLRPNFLKSVMFDQVMHKTFPGIGQALSHSYLHSAGIKLRQVIPKALREDYYSTVGQSQATILSTGMVAMDSVRDALNFRLGYTASIYEFEMSGPQLYWWGLQYLLEHLPERAEDIFDVSINEAETSLQVDFYDTPESDEPFESIEFPSDPDSIDNTADYLFIRYSVQALPGLISEEDFPVEEVDDFSAVAGFGDPIDTDEFDVTYNWDEVVTVRDVYDDWEDTQEFVLPKSDTRENISRTYKKDTLIPASELDPEVLQVTETYVMTEGFKLVPEVTEEVTEHDGFTRYTTTTDFRVEPAKYSQYNKKIYEISKVNNQRVFIHTRGTDPIFDDLFNEAVTSGHFFPVIPIRYDTRPGTKPKPVYINENSTGQDKILYEKSKRVLGKSAGRNAYKDILENLKENDDVDDINYIYVMFGSSLNSPANSAKKYIYEFFKTFSDFSPESANNFNTYVDAYNVAHASRNHWIEWSEAQEDPGSPLFGTAEPALISYPQEPTRSVSMRSSSRLKLNYTVAWNHVRTETGTGVLPGMSPGKVKIEKTDESSLPPGSVITVVEGKVSVFLGMRNSGKSIKLTYQIDNDNWEVLTVFGLSSDNIIHRGKSVFIDAHEALDDEEESGFIIPMHETPFKSIRLVDATQYGASCTYLMLNYYSDTKTKWYQTKAFRIIMIVVIVVVSIFFPPAGAAGGAAMGATAAAAVGLTGAAALVFAAAVNAIAGIIVSKIISKAAVAIFGEQVGIIVGAIVSMVAMGAMNSYFSGQQVNLLDTFNSANLLKLVGTVSGDLSKHYQQEIMEIQSEAQKYTEEFQKQSDYLNELYAAEFSNRAEIDPLKFQERMRELEVMFETPDQFFSRTLMSGSDICNISLEAMDQVLNMDNHLTF